MDNDNPNSQSQADAFNAAPNANPVSAQSAAPSNVPGIFPHRPDFQSAAPAGDIILTPDTTTKKSKKPLLIAGVAAVALIFVAAIVGVMVGSKGDSDVELSILQYAAFLKLSPSQFEKVDSSVEAMREALDNDPDATPFFERAITGSTQLNEEELKQYGINLKKYADEIVKKVGKAESESDLGLCVERVGEMANVATIYLSMGDDLKSFESIGYTQALSQASAYGEYSGEDVVIYNAHLRASDYATAYIELFYSDDSDEEGLRQRLSQSRALYYKMAASLQEQILSSLSCVYNGVVEGKNA